MGQKPLHQSILVDQGTRLSILPAPPTTNHSLLAEFVFSNAMRTILEELRKHFEIVVVDAPPLLPLVDGRVLGEYADHIVVAAQWDRTPQDLLARAIEHLDHVHDRVVGTVLSQVDLQQAGLYDAYYSSVYLRPYEPPQRTHPEPAA
jgi:polysaccharide biosynthesis transport protein